MSGNEIQRSCWTIAVLYGGRSAEREVSLASGQAVAKALEERGHHVVLIDADPEGLHAVSWSGIDVVFNALHGSFGEDGSLQQFLEVNGLPYTGSGPAASRLTFSKSATKQKLNAHGLPTPVFRLIHHADENSQLRKWGEEIGYPLVVKPDRQGSSLGVSIVRSASELPQAVEACFRFGHFGLLESYVPGEEWTVPVFDDQPLPAILIETSCEFFDYQAKYEDHRTSYQVVGSKRQGDEMLDLSKIACQVCHVLGTAGIARVDFRVDPGGHPWVLEVNTSPGMTDHSLVPKSAERAGYSLGRLCEEACRRAWTRSVLMQQMPPESARRAG